MLEFIPNVYRTLSSDEIVLTGDEIYSGNGTWIAANHYFGTKTTREVRRPILALPGRDLDGTDVFSYGDRRLGITGAWCHVPTGWHGRPFSDFVTYGWRVARIEPVTDGPICPTCACRAHVGEKCWWCGNA